MSASKTTKCRHFRAMIEHDTCAVGLHYDDFKGDTRLSLPCFSSPGCKSCPQFSPWTQEEVDAWERECDQRFEEIGKARKAIVAHIAETGKRSGYMPCVVCNGGTRHYSQAGNGHVHSGCTTQGCPAWME